MLVENICNYCGNSYAVKKKYSKVRKFCSSECSQKAKQQREVFNCAFCQKEVIRVKSAALKSKQTLYFCNADCRTNASVKSVDAEPILKVNYKGLDSSKYRENALSFYGAACKRCGYVEIEKMLDVHHIDGNRKNNKIENLCVLCVWCHALITRKVCGF